MILLIFLIGQDKVIFNEKDFIDKYTKYEITRDKNVEKEFLDLYKNVRPYGIDTYIKYLLLKKDDKKIREEIDYLISYLRDGNKIPKVIYSYALKALILLKDDENFYKNLSAVLSFLLRDYEITYREREVRPILFRFFNNYSNLDSLSKYENITNLLGKEWIEKVNNYKKDKERKEKLLFFLRNMKEDSALNFVKNNYEKTLVYFYFGDFDKGEIIMKNEYKDSTSLLPFYILIKSGARKEDIKTISSKFLGLEGDIPQGELSKFFYTLIFDTLIQFEDKNLAPYLLYFKIEEGKEKKEAILKNYPNTSPAFIIRNTGK
uniref:Uncharacterized protein n=1 Tax=candidate division WOR-3 bacterium TaxID=2052148 RepID=A0A7C4U853_UNCW3